MSDDESEGRQNASTRRSVIEFMRERILPGARHDQSASKRKTRTERTGPPAFADLPEYKQVLVHQAAGVRLNVPNPFFRAHEAAAGATTSIAGRSLANFASYDYLGLNRHPKLRQAATQAIERYGVSASASRLVAGERPVHGALEERIAAHYGVDDSIVFVSGYLTNVTTIGCLTGPPDLILHDEFVHNSALAGAQFSGAARRSFRHNDLADLERLLSSLALRHRRVLVIVEGLYSMDGDLPDLPALIALRARFGFWLMVDEAHALGTLGLKGRGSFEHFGCDPRDVDIWMGTLSKTTASCGGYIAGNRELVAILKGYAGGFVYSVGQAPALAAAALAGFDLIAREPWRIEKLRQNGRYFLQKAQEAGLDTGSAVGHAVVPVLVGDSVRAVYLSNALFDAGVNVLPILFPAVPEGRARLRFFVTTDHTREQIDDAVRLTAEHLRLLIDQGVSISRLSATQIARDIAQSRDAT